MGKNNYRKEFTQSRVQSVFISIIIRIRPKYKPLSQLNPKKPNPEIGELFKTCFDAALTHYSGILNKLYSVDCAFNNVNLDTGKETVTSEYVLVDQVYFELLMRLEKNEFVHTNKRLKKNLVAYFDRHGAAEDKTRFRKNKMIAEALAQLNSITSIRLSSN
jgi:hypothetical protein